MEKENRKISLENNEPNDNGMGETSIARAEDTEEKNLAPSSEETTEGATQITSEQAAQNEKAQEIETPSLEEQLQKYRKEAEEYLDLAKRARAELINYRNRVQREREEFRKYANENLILELVPIIDSINSALSAYEGADDSQHPLVQGLKKINEQFLGVLRNHNVKLFGEVGDKFDSNLYEPILTNPSADVTEEVIASVFQKGIMIGERVIKPAVVAVNVPMRDKSAEEVKPQQIDNQSSEEKSGDE